MNTRMYIIRMQINIYVVTLYLQKCKRNLDTRFWMLAALGGEGVKPAVGHRGYRQDFVSFPFGWGSQSVSFHVLIFFFFHCGGFSCCGAQALGHVGFSSCCSWA